MLLPIALIESNYGSVVCRFLRASFATTKVIRVRERLFKGTRQQVVVVAADGFGGSGELQVGEVERASEISEALVRELKDVGPDCPLKQAFLDGSAIRTWNTIDGMDATRRLGSLASIRIGSVTGANDFFVIDKKESAGLAQDSLRFAVVVSRGKWLAGLTWSKADIRWGDQRGNANRLLIVANEALPVGQLRKRITVAEYHGIDLRSHCAKRDPWYSLDEFERPDAFFRYMGHARLGLVLNEARSVCTNAVHRLWWRRRSIPAASVAVACQTTFVQLGCELLGRSYGGGVLKLEPGDLRRLPIAVAGVAGRQMRRIDGLLREGNDDAARAEADRVVLIDGLGISASRLDSMSRALAHLRASRYDTD